MTATIDQIKKAAQSAYGYFEKENTRDNREIWVKTDGAPLWVDDLIQAAHGEFMPDDNRYEFIIEALSGILNYDDPENISLEPDVYTHDLLKWLASNINRIDYVNEALQEGLVSEDSRNDIVKIVSAGQYLEKKEVLEAVLQWLNEHPEPWIQR